MHFTTDNPYAPSNYRAADFAQECHAVSDVESFELVADPKGARKQRIALRITFYRLCRGWSKNRLALELGVPTLYVWKWESTEVGRYRSRPSDAHMQKLAELFELSGAWELEQPLSPEELRVIVEGSTR